MGGTESTEVTAGIWGFLVFFGLALACWFLFRSMNAHLRRMKYVEREREWEAAHPEAGSPNVTDDPIGAPERHTSVD